MRSAVHKGGTLSLETFKDRTGLKGKYTEGERSFSESASRSDNGQYVMAFPPRLPTLKQVEKSPDPGGSETIPGEPDPGCQPVGNESQSAQQPTAQRKLAHSGLRQGLSSRNTPLESPETPRCPLLALERFCPKRSPSRDPRRGVRSLMIDFKGVPRLFQRARINVDCIRHQRTGLSSLSWQKEICCFVAPPLLRTRRPMIENTREHQKVECVARFLVKPWRRKVSLKKTQDGR